MIINPPVRGRALHQRLSQLFQLLIRQLAGSTRRPLRAPDLNPTEGVWSHVKRSLSNLAAANVDHLAAIVRNRLKRIQYRTDLLNSFLTHTA